MIANQNATYNERKKKIHNDSRSRPDHLLFLYSRRERVTYILSPNIIQVHVIHLSQQGGKEQRGWILVLSHSLSSNDNHKMLVGIVLAHQNQHFHDVYSICYSQS